MSGIENKSEKYLYNPQEDDFIELYKKYLKKTKAVKTERIKYCIKIEIIFTIIYLIELIISTGGNPITIGTMVFLFPLLCVIIWFIAIAGYINVYMKTIRNAAKSNPYFYEKRWISFDGYHLISESDHITLMITTRDKTFKAHYNDYGIVIKCFDGYRFYPSRIFRSTREMMEFYSLLTWNEEYEEKYQTK